MKEVKEKNIFLIILKRIYHVEFRRICFLKKKIIYFLFIYFSVFYLVISIPVLHFVVYTQDAKDSDSANHLPLLAPLPQYLDQLQPGKEVVFLI